MKLRVEKAIYGGAGLARITPGEGGSALEGKTVFVPYALPGELVEAHIVEDRRGFSTAQLDRVVEPAEGRVTPHCEYFPVCGGCQYQQAGAQSQLRIKLDILDDTLARARIPRNEGMATGAIAAAPWGYRNRIRLHIARQQSGGTRRLRLCYRERGSHTNLPVTHCPIAAPILESAIAAVSIMPSENGLAEQCDEIEFFTNGEQDQLLVSLWARAANPLKHTLDNLLKDFSRQLQARLPVLAGVGVLSRGRGEDQLLGHWGQSSLVYTVAERRYRVSLGSFFQVNRFLIGDLIGLVAGGNASGSGVPSAPRSGRIAWDLYAGAGLFAAALGYEHVTAVEASPHSAADLKHNLAGTAHRAVQSTTLDFLRAQSRGAPRIRPDLLLLDPPRDGLGKEICAHVAHVASPEIVYVSCDPATLARDLQALLHFGYRLESLYMVDLFPQTFHLETVAVLKC